MRRKILLSVGCLIMCLMIVGCRANRIDEYEDSKVEVIKVEDDSLYETKTEENSAQDAQEEKIEDFTQEKETEKFLQEWQMGTLYIVESEDISELYFGASCDEEVPKYSIEIKSRNGEILQTITYEGERIPDIFKPHILVEDVNLDNSDDLLLYLGTYGNAAIEKYACYVFDVEQHQYVPVEGFEELSNPSMEKMLSTSSHVGMEYQIYKKYKVEGERLILAGELTEKMPNYFEEENKYIYDEILYEGGEVVSQKYDVEADDVDEELWGDYLYLE